MNEQTHYVINTLLDSPQNICSYKSMKRHLYVHCCINAFIGNYGFGLGTWLVYWTTCLSNYHLHNTL